MGLFPAKGLLQRYVVAEQRSVQVVSCLGRYSIALLGRPLHQQHFVGHNFHPLRGVMKKLAVILYYTGRYHQLSPEE